MAGKFKSPGPKYGLPNTIGHEDTDLRLDRAPAFSMGQRLPWPRASTFRTPGPKYALGTLTRYGPVTVTGTSLAAKDTRRRTQRGPGPTAYNVVPCLPLTKPAMPMYSMGMKWATRSKATRTPAPSKYSLAPTIGNQLPDMPSAPKFSIAGRHAAGPRQNRTPGPARYAPVPMDTFKTQPPRPVLLGRLDTCYRKGTPAPNKYVPGPGGSRFADAPMYSVAGRVQAEPYYTAADRVPDWQ